MKRELRYCLTVLECKCNMFGCPAHRTTIFIVKPPILYVHVYKYMYAYNKYIIYIYINIFDI